MFLNQFRVAEDVEEFEIVENVIDPIYVKVFQRVSPNMILDMMKI